MAGQDFISLIQDISFERIKAINSKSITVSSGERNSEILYKKNKNKKKRQTPMTLNWQNMGIKKLAAIVCLLIRK
jgi:hypothetical protein